MKDSELETLTNALRCLPSQKKLVVEAIPLYFAGGEPKTIDSIFEWFGYHFGSMQVFETYFGNTVDWDKQINKLVKQLKKWEMKD